MAILRRKAAGVRWGSVSELDRRIRVSTTAFRAQPRRLQFLGAWRAAHLVGNGHTPIQMAGTRAKTRPSSNLPLSKMVSFVKERE